MEEPPGEEVPHSPSLLGLEAQVKAKGSFCRLVGLRVMCALGCAYREAVLGKAGSALLCSTVTRGPELWAQAVLGR